MYNVLHHIGVLNSREIDEISVREHGISRLEERDWNYIVIAVLRELVYVFTYLARWNCETSIITTMYEGLVQNVEMMITVTVD